MYCFVERGHSTTTWTRTRREGEGVNKQSTLVHPRGGGVSGCPRGQNFEKMANDYEKSRLGQNWSTQQLNDPKLRCQKPCTKCGQF